MRLHSRFGIAPLWTAIALAVPSAPAFAITEFQKLTASDFFANDNFGYSVGISGNTSVIGAWRDDDGESDAGSAYIFRNPGSGAWSQLDKLHASDPDMNDNFGASVAIAGNTVVIGAPGDDTRAGSAYIFRDNGAGDWLQIDKLLASDRAANDELGISVAISGNTAIVGAPGENGKAGAAYVFRDNGAGDWQQVVKLLANDGAINDQFGYSVAISGTTALIGARFDSTPTLGGAGSVYVFQDNGGSNWSQVTKLMPSDASNNMQFGTSLALSSNTAAIGAIGDSTNGTGAGAAYVFRRNVSQVWQEADKLLASDGAAGDEFGYSIGIDGSAVVVGAWHDNDLDDDTGSAYLYRTNSIGSWNQVAKLRASQPEVGDVLGNAAGVSGGVAIVGATLANNGIDSGAAFLYNVPNVLAGDYNLNGQVDAADAVVWRNQLGQIGPGLAADGNGDGVVNAADRSLWRKNFGLTAAGSGGHEFAQVPEPATALVLIAGACATAISIRRRFTTR